MFGRIGNNSTRKNWRQSKSTADSIDIKEYNKACMEIMRRHERGEVGNEGDHMRIVQEELERVHIHLPQFKNTQRVKPVPIPSQQTAFFTPPLTPTWVPGPSSGFESTSPVSSLPKEFDPTTPPPSFIKPSTSAPVSSPSSDVKETSTAKSKISGIMTTVDFVFNVGAVNATKTPIRTMKLELDGGAFEMIAHPDTEQPIKKKKVFSPEELEKQASIVDEFRKKVRGSM